MEYVPNHHSIRKTMGLHLTDKNTSSGKRKLSSLDTSSPKTGWNHHPTKWEQSKSVQYLRTRRPVHSFLGMAGYLDSFVKNYAAIAASLFHWKKEEESFQENTRRHLKWEDHGILDPSRPIIIRTEASFNEGLSAALLQKTDRGIQPVHFISRTMKETEKRYSQTEDALAIKWAKERLGTYLHGAPRFRIITAHNNVKAKMPPRIEKWVMEMQDVIMN